MLLAERGWGGMVNVAAKGWSGDGMGSNGLQIIVGIIGLE